MTQILHDADYHLVPAPTPFWHTLFHPNLNVFSLKGVLFWSCIQMNPNTEEAQWASSLSWLSGNAIFSKAASAYLSILSSYVVQSAPIICTFFPFWWCTFPIFLLPDLILIPIFLLPPFCKYPSSWGSALSHWFPPSSYLMKQHGFPVPRICSSALSFLNLTPAETTACSTAAIS